MADPIPRLLPYKSWRWKLLHVVFKSVLRFGVAILYYCIKGTYKKKMQEGWINPELPLLHQDIGEVIESNYRYDKNAWIGEAMCGNIKHLKPENKDVKLWTRGRAIVCTFLDEDTYYFLRFLYLLDLTFRHQEQYRLEMHKQRAYWNWQEIQQWMVLEEQKLRRREKYVGRLQDIHRCPSCGDLRSGEPARGGPEIRGAVPGDSGDSSDAEKGN